RPAPRALRRSPGGTASTAWRCRPARTRGAAAPDRPGGATTPPAGGSPDTARLRPGTTPAARTLPRRDTRARLLLFGGSERVVDFHDRPIAPTPPRRAGVAPGAVVLPGVPGGPQYRQDGGGAHGGQPIRGAAQRPLQRRERPGGGAILVAVGRAVELGQDPRAFGRAVLDRRAAPIPRRHGRQALPIEARDQPGHRVSVPTPHRVGRGREGGAVGHGEQQLGAGDPVGAVAGSPGELSER